MPHHAAPTLFYGWKVVAGLLFILTFATGLSFYNHAVILNSLAQNPAFTMQSASLAVSLFFLTAGFAGIWVARFLQEFDVRSCFTAGAMISSVALTALSLVHNVWQLYMVYILFGIGWSASNLIPATTLVNRWFHKRRAVALSVAFTGVSLGGVIITPLCAILVENLGLAAAAPWMGLLYLVGVIPMTWLVLRPYPATLGLMPDGEPAQPDAWLAGGHSVPAASLHVGIALAEARRSRFFWGMSLSYVFLMLAQVGGISHQYGLASELLNEVQTAIVVAIIPTASIIGRLVGGRLVEQFSTRRFAIAMMVLQVVSLALLAGGFNIVSLCLGLALFGITVGNLLMLQPLLIAEAFGVRDYPRIFSLSNLLTSWGTASGPLLLGAVYAASQNQYGMAYGVAGTSGLLGLLLFLGGGRTGKVHE